MKPDRVCESVYVMKEALPTAHCTVASVGVASAGAKDGWNVKTIY